MAWSSPASFWCAGARLPKTSLPGTLLAPNRTAGNNPWQVTFRFADTENTAYMALMFDRLLSALMRPDPAPLPQPDARLALAALLVRLARADENYTGPERARIDSILATRYNLPAADASALRAEAEVLEAEAPDTVRFTRALKDAVPHEDRMSLMEAMWSVALSDDDRDAREDAVIRITADLLGINDRDRATARQTVETKKK